jgi:predicted HNH restriction endonuclease
MPKENQGGNQGLKDKFFPIIARIIKDLYRETKPFVTRDDILARLLKDTEAQKLVSQRALESKASNIVAWFSAHFTMHKNGDKRFRSWASLFDGFERIEIEGQAAYKPTTVDAIQIFPDEVQEEMVFREGAMRQVLVNAYERDFGARTQCLAKYGDNCFICKFSFCTKYGKVADGFIHVHHLRQLSEIRKEYVVDPIKDLRPVCPNCHAVLHLRNPAYTIEEVVAFLRGK